MKSGLVNMNNILEAPKGKSGNNQNLKSSKFNASVNRFNNMSRNKFQSPKKSQIKESTNKSIKVQKEDKIPENWVVEVDDPNYKKTILIAGDSTAESNGGNDGETEGWGKYLGNYLSFFQI